MVEHLKSSFHVFLSLVHVSCLERKLPHGRVEKQDGLSEKELLRREWRFLLLAIAIALLLFLVPLSSSDLCKKGVLLRHGVLQEFLGSIEEVYCLLWVGVLLRHLDYDVHELQGIQP